MEGDSGRYQLALDEARRGFDQQSVEFGRVRERAGSALGFGGLVSSFLGGLAIRDGAPIGPWTWVAVGAFVVLAGAALTIVFPREFHIAQDPRTLAQWVESGASIDAMHKRQADALAKQYDHNKNTVDRLIRLYSAAIAALGVLIVALVLDLWSRR